MDRPLHPTRKFRTRLWLLLPLLLALAQQGAWLHELSHAAYAAAPHQVRVQQAENTLENGVCPSCQSFGQLGSALASSLTAPPAALTQLRPCSEPQYSQPRAQLPAPRNRGPPSLI
ncbi:MAG: hypothetical protein WA825_08750 [Steroidobacteraceae bacterium]